MKWRLKKNLLSPLLMFACPNNYISIALLNVRSRVAKPPESDIENDHSLNLLVFFVSLKHGWHPNFHPRLFLVITKWSDLTIWADCNMVRYDFCTNQITTKLLLLYKPDEKRPNTSSVTSLDNSSSNYYACHLTEQSLPVSFHVVSSKYLVYHHTA